MPTAGHSGRRGAFADLDLREVLLTSWRQGPGPQAPDGLFNARDVAGSCVRPRQSPRAGLGSSRCAAVRTGEAARRGCSEVFRRADRPALISGRTAPNRDRQRKGTRQPWQLSTDDLLDGSGDDADPVNDGRQVQGDRRRPHGRRRGSLRWWCRCRRRREQTEFDGHPDQPARDKVGVIKGARLVSLPHGLKKPRTSWTVPVGGEGAEGTRTASRPPWGPAPPSRTQPRCAGLTAQKVGRTRQGLPPCSEMSQPVGR